jgi:hypothetical protein
MFKEEKKLKQEMARAIYPCGIPFNMFQSPYWQDMVRTINIAPQRFHGPNYENLQTNLLKKEN